MAETKPDGGPVAALRRKGRPAFVAGLIVALAALLGCRSSPAPGGVIYGYVGIDGDQAGSSRASQGVRRQIARLKEGFRRLHPGTELQLVFFPEDSLAEELVRRERSGLGPDLVLSNGNTARNLAEHGLTRTVRMPHEVLRRLSPSMLEGLRSTDGSLTALPVVMEPQLACFNRSRLPAPPRSTEELLALSAQRLQVGLAIEPMSLFWSSGSLGASEALAAAAAGAPLSAAQRQAVVGWMGWLLNASLQQRISFYANQEQLKQELQAGRADWIPCRSSDLQDLRASLGNRLGVAVLPDGPQHPASPINRLKVWSFGRNSSPRQRVTAEAFASYSINPLVQRNITVGTQATLPVNRFVQVPVQSSAVLQVLVAAAEQAGRNDSIASLVRGRSSILERARDTLSQLVFGELTPERAASQLIVILEGGR
jgi:arabinogalactan oligomer/maltooligosaccharide transport system substrate-binding protein